MLARNHIIVSGIAGGIWYYVFRSMPESLACFLSGFLVDMDHLFDYYFSHPFTLSFRKMSKAFCLLNLKRIFVFLHSGELAILIWIIGIISYPDRIWLAIATGFTHHLIFDQIFNNPYPFAYFLTYRILKGFQKQHLFCRAYYEKKQH